MQEKEFVQTLYINLDDSGKLSTNEEILVLGGVVFLSKEEKDKFITQYRSIVDSIKCNYCQNKICKNNCPELKHNNLSKNDKRRIINYIKKYFVIACIIENKKIYPYIINDKASKGRYTDYAIRRFIKEVITNLIEKKKMNPYKKVKLVLNIDEQSTKSNGYYNLRNGLFEELKHGITNFNYGTSYEPILFNDLEIDLTYQKSNHSYVVQAADLVAGTVRRKTLDTNFLTFKLNEDSNLLKNLAFLDYKIFLP